MARLPKLRKGVRALIGWRGILLAVLILALSLFAFKAQRIIGFVGSLQDRLDRLQAAADGDIDLGLRELGETLRDTQADVHALRHEAAPFLPLTSLLGWVPGVGGDLRAAPALLDVALSVIDASIIAYDGLEPVVALSEGEGGDGQALEQVVSTLSDARPALEAAQAELDVAQQRRTDIDDDALSGRTANLVAQLDRFLPLMDAALDGGRVLPDLLGASGRRTYLILAQNNDELRATGGFISAVGLLVLDKGGIVDIGFEDSYAVTSFRYPHPDSPPALLRYMGIDQWVFRDANWSPDFPASAQKAIELYRISRDLDVDGVLAVNQHTLRKLVAGLAPLEVEGWPEAVTEENVTSLVRWAWSPEEVASQAGIDVEWWRQRKSFMDDLFAAMQAKIETEPDQVNWMALGRAVFQVLNERQLQVWLTHPTDVVGDLLAMQGWDGAMRQTTSDYLMVIDSNMGYNKVNAIVQESLDYRIVVNTDGQAQATLTMRHVHPGDGTAPCDPRPHYGADYNDLVNRCYWDYVRVYVPSGSQLLAGTAHPVSAELLITGQSQPGSAEVLPEENGKAVFGSFFVLPRGQETETRFVYQLPPGTLQQTDGDWRYRLLVQKQAGTQSIPLRVALALPPGASVQSVEVIEGDRSGPAPQRPEPNVVLFNVSLDTDQVFEIFFRLNQR